MDTLKEKFRKLDLATKISIIGLIVTIIVGVIGLLSPEVRYFLGIEKNSVSERNIIPPPSTENVKVQNLKLTENQERPSIQTNFTSTNNTTENNKISHSALKKEQIAKNNIYINNLKNRIDRLIDQDILVCVAINDKHPNIRNSAINKLTDQNALAYVAINDEHPNNRNLAINKLTDQNALAYIAINEEHPNNRQLAIERATKLSKTQR